VKRSPVRYFEAFCLVMAFVTVGYFVGMAHTLHELESSVLEYLNVHGCPLEVMP